LQLAVRIIVVEYIVSFLTFADSFNTGQKGPTLVFLDAVSVDSFSQVGQPMSMQINGQAAELRASQRGERESIRQNWFLKMFFAVAGREHFQSYVWYQ